MCATRTGSSCRRVPYASWVMQAGQAVASTVAPVSSSHPIFLARMLRLIPTCSIPYEPAPPQHQLASFISEKRKSATEDSRFRGGMVSFW